MWFTDPWFRVTPAVAIIKMESVQLDEETPIDTLRVCVCMCLCVCMCVYVCVKERDREIERVNVGPGSSLWRLAT